MPDPMMAASIFIMKTRSQVVYLQFGLPRKSLLKGVGHFVLLGGEIQVAATERPKAEEII